MDSNSNSNTKELLAVPVVVNTPLYDYGNNNNNNNNNNRLIKYYILESKNCLSYIPICYLSKTYNKWILDFNIENNTKYNRYTFQANSSVELYNILQKLGLRDNKYRIKLKNNSFKILTSIKLDTLEEVTTWCFNTEIELNTVRIY